MAWAIHSKIQRPFEWLELSIQKNLLAIQTVPAVPFETFVNRSSYLLEKTK